MHKKLRGAQRGSIAVEMGLAIPVLFFVLLGGLQFGRALITRHRLENAVAFAARTSVVSNQTGPGQVAQLVRNQLGTEQNRCTALRINSRVVAQPGGNPDALEVTADCTLLPMFQTIPGVDELRAVSAMPLPLN